MIVSPLTLTGNAWQFYKKQPLLNQVIGWLIIAPLTCSLLVQVGLEQYNQVLMELWNISNRQLQIVGIIIEFLFTLWLLWGLGSILVIGTRIIKSSAGRTRSSFSTVHEKGKKLVVPLLLTNLIRECITVLLALPYFIAIILFLMIKSPEQINTFVQVLSSIVFNNPVATAPEFPYGILVMLFVALPLLIPVVLYRIKTSFYHVIVGIENIAYRKALQKSAEAMKGKLWPTFVTIVGISICTFLPVIILTSVLSSIIINFDARLTLVTILFNAAGSGIALAVYTLATIDLYHQLTTSNN